MDINQVIERARLGNDAAWEHLVDQNQQAVFRLAYLILGEYDDAKDITQETFIRAHHNFSRFDSERPLRPWLYGIASNLAYNHYRSKKRRKAVRTQYQQKIKGHGSLPEETTFREIEAQNLHQAVSYLKRRDQEVIYLRFFLELTIDETAASLDIAPGTVKSRLHRALKRLQGVIQRDFPDLEDRFEDE